MGDCECAVDLLSFRRHNKGFSKKPPLPPLPLIAKNSSNNNNVRLKKNSYRVSCFLDSIPQQDWDCGYASGCSSPDSECSEPKDTGKEEDKKKNKSKKKKGETSVRSSSLSRLFRRSRSPSKNSSVGSEGGNDGGGDIRLLSYRRRSSSLTDLEAFTERRLHGNGASTMMEGSESKNDPIDSVAAKPLQSSDSPPPSKSASSAFPPSLRNGNDRVSQFLDHGRFMHIPPPAGFDSPTRPSTLLAALVRGPVSLDEASLSPATQRRLAYIHRHTQSSYQIRSRKKTEAEEDAEDEEDDFLIRSGKKKEEDWSELPTSPLSPPSPFQHPFFRRQLGLLPPEPWARFSGFGLPRFNPLFRDSGFRDSSSRELSQPEDDADEGKECVRKRSLRRTGKYRTSSAGSVLCYCQESKSYKVCGDSQHQQQQQQQQQVYSDGVSETESEDDEDEAYATPVNSKNLLLQLHHHQIHHNNNNNNNNNNNHLQANSSSGEDVLPCSSTSTASSNNNSSNVSVTVGPPSPKFIPIVYEGDVLEESKRNSQAVSSEADIDDISSLTSEPESFHDAPSPRSSVHSPEFPSNSLPPCPSCNESRQESEEPTVIENGPDRGGELPRDKDSSLAHPSPVNSSAAQEASSKKEKLHKIALELLHTERSYVDVLHLIDQEFQFRVDQQNRVHHLFPPDQMPLMFANIKSIYKLHHDFLLPQLEERMAQWESCSRIGDIMKSFAPFLKMYTEYVRNFDNAMTFISSWQAKSHRFAAIMEEIHQMKSCGNLTLQHHMLSPVQRIPRYEMLLKDYLRKLPEDNPDREDTEQALHLVSTAANHANDAMKKIDKFQKLLEVQESLGGAIELVSPTRELLKEGRIIKISARSGDHQERYLFLLSDLLLLCTPRLMGGRVISGPQYRLRARYKVENLEVLEGDNLETANTFYIRDNNKTVELYTQTKEEKESWLSALFQAINETYRRKSSLRLASHPDQKAAPDPDLGHKQPTLIRTDSVTKCMQCGSQFSVVRRKHHCRACGSVVCYKCSNHKASLACESGKSVRVCRTCHETLNELGSGTSSPSPETEDKDNDSGQSSRPDSMDSKKFENLMFKSRGVLEVSANASGAIMQGFLQLKTHRKAWLKRWFALHRDFVLYSFKNDDDLQALTATPVPGFTVARLQNTKGESGLCEKDKDRAFKLYHSKKQYVFLSSSKEDAAKWVSALQKASRAELPSPIQ